MAKRRVDAVEALKLALERERGANKFYRQAAETVKDANGQRTFRWLAKEELRHVAKLRAQLKSHADTGTWLEWKRLSPPIAKSELPPEVSEAKGPVPADSREKDVLRQAIAAEKEAQAFYNQCEDGTPDLNGKTMFKALAKEEEGHQSLLEEELKWIIESHKYFTLHRFQLRG